MDFFCWACYINCIFKYYKIFVTDRYFSKLGLTVSDSDWNIYVMAPMQRGKMQGVGLGTWQQGSHTGLPAFLPCCTELPRQLSPCSVPSGSSGRAHHAESPTAEIWTDSPFLPPPKSFTAEEAQKAGPVRERDQAALPEGCLWVQEGVWKDAPCPGQLPPALAQVLLCRQSLPETEHSFW